MDNFIVSARKYRPATFDTVVGQSGITTTLKNAIKNNHLAQAFLFCGPRGVGKTTCARILAKTINCFNVTENIEACDVCDSCVSFREGQSLNIYELDAASNNSVDDIRTLIEQVRIAPQLGTKKVYIIDEVHMLSAAAFNAFLKTLEEPPKHAIFILATTEKHKILPTILSRCQIFDFQRIKADDMVQHLASIAKKENYETEEDGLHIIAQKADGGLRDALSMFDQIISFAGKISYQAVIENLNILDYDYYFRAIEAILKRDLSSTLLLANEVLAKGFDGHNFINGLSAHIRNLLVCKDVQTLVLLDVGNNIKEKYKTQSIAVSAPYLIEMLNVLNKADLSYKSSKNQRLLLELSLIQLCNIGAPPVITASADEKKNDISVQNSPENTIRKDVPQQEPQQTEVVKETTSQGVQEQETTGTDSQSLKAFSALKNVKGINNYGLNQINKPLEEPKDKQEEIKETSGPESVFSIQTLEKFWNDYALEVNNSGKKSLYIALSTKKPQLIDKYTILLTVENEVQREAVKNELTDLVLFLRNKLNNFKINIQVEVAKGDSSKKYYTSKEKYLKMAEKNPHLNTLFKKLDLDIEY
jgi:DNA polymerase III subunit gamma/tau